ncbi:hypothetical protein NC00_17145 [Xanthomonas cannabis pv. phaseoli]|uniref:Uncharacterized protein n=1 Tax=Xanthomonas cannabis pv. phaseoli TaxID=1885902 RepID=A0AB34P502_9XANT|nr:hypothetical protein NC00_17145 [Xanthomonas cannabis pv. phaseoli]PPU29949.1 hypothetical protein XspCFBP7912_17745 [Xanthomonas sp. CFBP 7912]RJS06004.1 hypothetical protein XnspCFBP7698_07620 [Xanthomonas sp. CFBP 7698]
MQRSDLRVAIQPGPAGVVAAAPVLADRGQNTQGTQASCALPGPVRGARVEEAPRADPIGAAQVSPCVLTGVWYSAACEAEAATPLIDSADHLAAQGEAHDAHGRQGRVVTSHGVASLQKAVRTSSDVVLQIIDARQSTSFHASLMPLR